MGLGYLFLLIVVVPPPPADLGGSGATFLDDYISKGWIPGPRKGGWEKKKFAFAKSLLLFLFLNKCPKKERSKA